MGIAIDSWMERISRELHGVFGPLVRCIGLQGSYRRKEAAPTSDIDLVVILDEVGMEEVKAYRQIIRKMPHSELACGFFCGERELLCWPLQELFQFYYDTEVYYGSLEFLQGRITPQAVREAVCTGAGTLYHAAVHSYLFENAAENLKGLYKMAFFLMQARTFQRTGRYYGSRGELAGALQGREREILMQGGDLADGRKEEQARTDQRYRMLIEWSAEILREG